MPTHALHLLITRLNPSQRASFALFIPSDPTPTPTPASTTDSPRSNASTPRSTGATTTTNAPPPTASTTGTLIHAEGTPMSGYALRFRRDCRPLADRKGAALTTVKAVRIGALDAGLLAESPVAAEGVAMSGRRRAGQGMGVGEQRPRGKLERVAVRCPVPGTSRDFMAPVDGTTNRRCQEWTVEFVTKLVQLKYLEPEALEIVKAHQDPPEHGISLRKVVPGGTAPGRGGSMVRGGQDASWQRRARPTMVNSPRQSREQSEPVNRSGLLSREGSGQLSRKGSGQPPMEKSGSMEKLGRSSTEKSGRTSTEKSGRPSMEKSKPTGKSGGSSRASSGRLSTGKSGELSRASSGQLSAGKSGEMSRASSGQLSTATTAPLEKPGTIERLGSAEKTERSSGKSSGRSSTDKRPATPKSGSIGKRPSMEKSSSLKRSGSLEKSISLERGASVTQSGSLEMMPPMETKPSMERGPSMETKPSLEKSSSLEKRPSMERGDPLEKRPSIELSTSVGKSASTGRSASTPSSGRSSADKGTRPSMEKTGSMERIGFLEKQGSMGRSGSMERRAPATMETSEGLEKKMSGGTDSSTWSTS